MMRRSLKAHPDWPPTAVRSIEVEVARGRDGLLSLNYFVRGDAGAVLMPPAEEPSRTDGLWKTTCYEAFIRTPGSEAYSEINLSPSGQWAAYVFDRYRTGMREAPLQLREFVVAPPALGLGALLDLSRIDVLAPTGPWRVALTAVIEETSGAKSYWALAHPPGRPDFHHPDGFALDLPRP